MIIDAKRQPLASAGNKKVESTIAPTAFMFMFKSNVEYDLKL